MLSQIQLISRKFLDIELHPQSTQGKENGFETSHMIVVLQDEDDPALWRTKFGIRIENIDDDQPAPYLGEITIAGTFKLDEEFPKEKAEQMVYLNSGAILYGAIRELVLSLTSQCVHGELILPAIDARIFLPETEKEKVQSVTVNE
ncbi:protein-export chaperone SecB [Akkermansiaceae bacterium]|nr:protein-export chaperone SecB [Akkermansiaceae bacterium]